MLVRSEKLAVVVIDSVAALTPRAEIEGQIGDQSVGVMARMMSQALRKLAGDLHRAGTLCVFVNQLREKVGVVYGSPEVTPGGRALKFYASMRLEVRRMETLKDGGVPVGTRTKVKVAKNKVAPPFREAEFELEFGTGISKLGCLTDSAVAHGVILRSGSYFTYGETKLGQGRQNVKAYLAEHPEIADAIEVEVCQAAGIKDRSPASESGDGNGLSLSTPDAEGPYQAGQACDIDPDAEADLAVGMASATAAPESVPSKGAEPELRLA